MPVVGMDLRELVIEMEAAADPSGRYFQPEFESIAVEWERVNDQAIRQEFKGRLTPHVRILNRQRSEPYFGTNRVFPKVMDWRLGSRYVWASNLAIARMGLDRLRKIAPVVSGDYRNSFYFYDAANQSFYADSPTLKVDPLQPMRIINIQPYARRLDKYGDRQARHLPLGIFTVVEKYLRRKYGKLAVFRTEWPRLRMWVRGLSGRYLQAKEPGEVQHPVLAILPRT